MTFHPEPFKASAIEIFDEPSAKATPMSLLMSLQAQKQKLAAKAAQCIHGNRDLLARESEVAHTKLTLCIM